MKPFRILLVDDHVLVRAGFRTLLEEIAGVEVVGEAGEGREALDLLRAHRPDLLITDISMVGMNGLDLAIQATQEFPGLRVIFLSMHATEVYVRSALRAGAAGYLLKNADVHELRQAIEAVARGEVYITPDVAKFLDASRAAKSEALTARQREILQLIAEGRSTKEIARTLRISVKTVESHRAQLKERLKIHDVAGLVRYAVHIGLVKPEE